MSCFPLIPLCEGKFPATRSQFWGFGTIISLREEGQPIDWRLPGGGSMPKQGTAPSPRASAAHRSPRSSSKKPATPRSTPRKKGSKAAQTPASELRQAFEVFDKDRDGAISRSELVAALSMPGPHAFSSPEAAASAADKIMADFDADGDGKLQFDEVSETTARIHPFALATKLHVYTHQLDVNNPFPHRLSLNSFAHSLSGTSNRKVWAPHHWIPMQSDKHSLSSTWMAAER